MTLKRVFKTENPFIGALHFTPLLGYKGYSNLELILKKSIKDLEALQTGGVDGVIIENNYDYPHKIIVGPETVSCMTYLAQELIKRARVPIGVSVLWNDYKAALSIAKVAGGKFVRVPVFVDHVKTSYGEVRGDAQDVVAYRKLVNAQDVLLFTDIHVKHAEILSRRSISTSALKAIKNGSDGLIITGKWTGEAPNLSELKKVRLAVRNFPILIGSGATAENIQHLLKYANGAIVSTSLKTNKSKDKVNIRGYRDAIDVKKVKKFASSFQSIF